jgi:hypothetical protein
MPPFPCLGKQNGLTIRQDGLTGLFVETASLTTCTKSIRIKERL